MYQLSGSTSYVIRISDGASIPTNSAIKDCADYIAWVTAGNFPSPAPAQNPNNVVIAQINALETNPPVGRFIREFMLRTAESLGATTDAHYLQAKALDDRIKLLRSQLK